LQIIPDSNIKHYHSLDSCHTFGMHPNSLISTSLSHNARTAISTITRTPSTHPIRLWRWRWWWWWRRRPSIILSISINVCVFVTAPSAPCAWRSIAHPSLPGNCWCVRHMARHLAAAALQRPGLTRRTAEWRRCPGSNARVVGRGHVGGAAAGGSATCWIVACTCVWPRARSC
jgi:hypothetical protein